MVRNDCLLYDDISNVTVDVIITTIIRSVIISTIPGRDTEWVRLKNPLQRIWRTQPSPGLAGEAGSSTSRAKTHWKLAGKTR